MGAAIDAGRRGLTRAGLAVRLSLALGLAMLFAGSLAYALISDRLEQHQLDSLAAIQHADAKGLERIGRENARGLVIREIDDILESIGGRPGTTEASLHGPNGLIVASSSGRLKGTRDAGPHVQAALERGSEYHGREEDPGEESTDFEFVTPVELPEGRHALEVSVDNVGLAAQLDGIRGLMPWIGLLVALVMSVLFYLLGGRSLLRSHRLALQRATLDGLTDLPNQRAFQAEFDQAAALAARDNRPLGLAVLDLDHFKLVNDRFGHPRGDALLQRVARILREGRSADRAFRIGGDEFALILPSTDAEGARTLARRLTRAFEEADAGVSIGVATIRSGEAAAELREEADAALYEAKRRGGGTAVHFEEIRGDVPITSSHKRAALVRLLDERRLTTVFQPIWELGPPRRVIGIEALSRPDESYGFSGPAEAFDVAAQAGLVRELDTACALLALRTAERAGLPKGAALFLNITPKTLEQDAGSSAWLREAVSEAGLAPEQVVIEVTEQMGSRTAPIMSTLRSLRALGFKIALDDVGTGNAGLEMLRSVDPDFVKIDRSIVAAAPTEPNARAVLLAMATFASHTGAFVIAEGIEDDEILTFLSSIEDVELRSGTIVHGGQGFKLGRPEPARGVEATVPVEER